MMMGGISILALLVVWLIQSWLYDTASDYGLMLNEGLQNAVLFTSLLIFALFTLVQAFGIRRGIRNLGPHVSSSI